MFVEDFEDDSSFDRSMCVHSVGEMEREGFQIIQATRTICVTEVHFNGPFHLEFVYGAVLPAVEIDSDYCGVKSTHRVVLTGGLPPGGKVAFKAVKD